MTPPKMYPLSGNGNTVSFCTNLLVCYDVVYENYQLLDYQANRITTALLSIEREPPAVRGKYCNHMDPLVPPTIRFILSKFVDENPQIPILFICDNSDGLAAARHKLFHRWCSSFRHKVIKYDSADRYHQHDFYASMIIREDHPQRFYLMDVFHKNIDRLFPDEFFPVMDCTVEDESMFPPDYTSFGKN